MLDTPYHTEACSCTIIMLLWLNCTCLLFNQLEIHVIFVLLCNCKCLYHHQQAPHTRMQFIWPRNLKRNGKPLTIAQFAFKSDASILVFPFARISYICFAHSHTQTHTFIHKNFTKRNTKLLTKPIDRQIPEWNNLKFIQWDREMLLLNCLWVHARRLQEYQVLVALVNSTLHGKWTIRMEEKEHTAHQTLSDARSNCIPFHCPSHSLCN